MLCHTCSTGSTDAPAPFDQPSPAGGGAPIGSRLQITDLQPGDITTVRRVFDGLSGRSRYLRFHAGRSTLPLRMQRGLADVRPGQHVAHVAMVGDRPVGLIRWIRFPHDRQQAEVAVEVVDALQRKGIGRLLIGRAARSALAAGVGCFVGYFSLGNAELRTWAISHGAVVDRHDGSVLRLPVDALLGSR